MEQGGKGRTVPSILWTAPFSSIHCPSDRASLCGRHFTGHSHSVCLVLARDGHMGAWDLGCFCEKIISDRGAYSQRLSTGGGGSTDYKTFTRRLPSSQLWKLHGRKTYILLWKRNQEKKNPPKETKSNNQDFKMQHPHS